MFHYEIEIQTSKLIVEIYYSLMILICKIIVLGNWQNMRLKPWKLRRGEDYRIAHSVRDTWYCKSVFLIKCLRPYKFNKNIHIMIVFLSSPEIGSWNCLFLKIKFNIGDKQKKSSNVKYKKDRQGTNAKLLIFVIQMIDVNSKPYTSYLLRVLRAPSLTYIVV